MTTYKTYQEAKIANPESVIYEFEGCFSVFKGIGSKECNPADYLPIKEQFSKAGHKLNNGDLFIVEDKVCELGKFRHSRVWHYAPDGSLILRAAALEKPQSRTKVEYVSLTESNFDVWALKSSLENGELFSRRSDGIYTMYSDRSPVYMINDFINYGVYRKVEIPITTRDLFIEEVEKQLKDIDFDGDWSIACVAAELFDFASKFKLLEQEGERYES